MSRQARFILLFLPLACVLMALVESLLSPGYVLKSAVRILLFGGTVAVYGIRFRNRELQHLFSPSGAKQALILSAAAFGVILGGFMLLRSWIDLDSIAAGLISGKNIHPGNFPLVALYICLVNSFLEELFFRGFGYLLLRRHWGEMPAALFSAGAFSLYHVSILSGWFPLWLFLLMLAGLFLCGLLFNRLDRRGSLYPSWLLHGSANAAINLIGCFMFGIL